MKLAFDKRTIDIDGRLHLDLTNISKACVNEYLGSEIPLEGLEPDKIYRLLRDPEELEKAASTFNNIQILAGVHAQVSANEPQTELIVGSTGTDAQFNNPYLKNSIVLWDAEAIKSVQNNTQKEISCAYRYTPVMTPGEYEGQKYDGVMTDIIGNHVSIVTEGRAGSDVVIGDQILKSEEKMMENEEDKTMATDSPDVPAETSVIQAADSDGDQGAILKQIAELIQQLLAGQSPTVAADEDDEDEKEETVTKTAMDAALAKQRLETRAIAAAERDVLPVVGELNIAFDSASDVYKSALSILGVKTDGIHPSAYKAIYDAHSKKQPAIAQDSISLFGADFEKRFPGVI